VIFCVAFVSGGGGGSVVVVGGGGVCHFVILCL